MTSFAITALIGLLSYSGAGIASADTQQAIAPQAPTYKSISVSMTGYNAVAEQTDGDPYTTASGAYSDPDVVAARSVDLADQLPYGTVIEVDTTSSTSASCGLSNVADSVGYRVIADSMHPRKRNQIDLLFHNDDSVRIGGKSVNAAIALGVCKSVSIHVIGQVDIKHMPKNQQELKLAIGQLDKAPVGNLVVSK
jgi:3D (Asp-Asp-Asp) domain-containing protein